jgi:Phosphatidylglycerophosphate synthase
MSVIPASFRSRVRAGVEPIARLFGRVGLTPNMLTLIGFGIAIVGAWLAATQAWLLAGLVVAFGAIFDLFDGALARATNRTSNFGAFLDSTMDRAGEAVVYIGIAIGLADVGLIAGPQVATAAMAAAFLVSYARARSESLGFSSGAGMASVGLAPREVRVAILTIGLIVGGYLVEPVRQFAPPWWIVIVGALALITVLATITTIQRILFTYNQSRSNQQEVNH